MPFYIAAHNEKARGNLWIQKEVVDMLENPSKIESVDLDSELVLEVRTLGPPISRLAFLGA